MNDPLPPLTPGTLYLVATPIGNLEDITLRALRTLKECDVVAAEDTRRTGQLLKHFGISKPLLSYFQFNEAKRSEEIIERLRSGRKGRAGDRRRQPGHQRSRRTGGAGGGCGRACVSSPCPGPARWWQRSRPVDYRPTNSISSGSCPTSPGSAAGNWNVFKTVGGTLVLYESPYRIEKLLLELKELFADRQVVLARELTKKFEECLRGTPADLLALLKQRSVKGECVVMVAGKDTPNLQPPSSNIP